MKEICGAKTRAGSPCRRRPSANGRCSLHGGKSLRGVASPSFRGRGWSKYLPSGLVARFNEARADASLIELRDELALTDVRIGELLEQVETGESGAAWVEVARLVEQLTGALEARDSDLTASVIRRLRSVSRQGVEQRAIWNELRDVVDDRRRLARAESRRLVELRQTITAEQLTTLIATLASIINQHLHGLPDIRRAITIDLQAVLEREQDERRMLSSGD